MTQVALHYFRYIDAETTFVKNGGGSLFMVAGWYNLTSILSFLRDGGVTCSWDPTTNRTAFNPAINCNNATARSFLGISSGSQSAGSSAPQFTWIPEKAQYQQEMCPIGVGGKRKYDTDFYTTQSGATYALGSVSTHVESFKFSLVKKQDVFTISGDAGLSSPFIDNAYSPDECLVFELKQGDNIACSAGYSTGDLWCHAAEPEVTMQMPPWDLYYNVKIEANRYVIS